MNQNSTQNETMTANEWILKAINSSVTPFHIEACYKLVDLFKEKYPDELNMDADLRMAISTRERMLNHF
jgi:hypothetical protein